MRVRAAFLFIIMIVISLHISNCGDDNKNPIESIEIVRPVLFVRGDISTISSQSVSGALRIWGLDRIEPEVDSVKIGDSICLLDNRPNLDEVQQSYRDAIFQSQPNDTGRYHRGDSVEVEIFCPEGSSKGKVKIIDKYQDRVTLLNNPPSNITYGETVGMIWDKVPSADWYTVMVDVYWGNPPFRFSYYYYHTTDTTFVVDHAGSQVTMLRIFVNAVAGPLPDERHNNFGNSVVVGSLYSSTYWTVTNDITVGSSISEAPDIQVDEPPTLLDILSR